MGRKMLLEAAVLGLAVAFVLAPATALAESVVKIGFVDISRAFNEYHKTEEAGESLDADRKKKLEAIDEREAEIRRRVDELEDRQYLWPKDKREETEELIQGKREDLEAFKREANRRLQREEKRIFKEIMKEVTETIRAMAVREGYSMVLDDRVVLFGSEAVDLTEQVIAELNQAEQ